MSTGFFKVPKAKNEVVKSYIPGSKERDEIKMTYKEMINSFTEVPMYINGKDVKSANKKQISPPHDHQNIVGEYYFAEPKHIDDAIESALAAKQNWENMSWENRSAIFLKAAELIAGPYRSKINAATMIGQSKTVHQAEIDSACELIDFWRFNVDYARAIYEDLQPPISPDGVWNQSEIRPLEGFVFSITPFNFTSIAGNLPSCAAIMGNTGVWKPSRNSYLSNYVLMQLMMEAGLPDGVINFLPGSGAEITEVALANPDFAGLHFTGSTATFQGLWQEIGIALPNLRSYPRIVGETGGKDFVVAHPNCNERGLLVALLRGSFEFQGQKCSAASRAYVPQSVWSSISDELCDEIRKIKMGDAKDFTNFMTAVIDQRSFDKITGYIDRAREDKSCEVIVGGNYDDSIGWFIEPTIIVTSNPKSETMIDEIFGPVLTVYVYDDDKFDEVLTLCDESSPYALTGSIFANDESDVQKAFNALRFTAGNFYINDKPTGAVVAQQPFGGARASGTNDKAGGPLNLLRWISPRSVKRTFEPPQDWDYQFMQSE